MESFCSDVEKEKRREERKERYSERKNVDRKRRKEWKRKIAKPFAVMSR